MQPPPTRHGAAAASRMRDLSEMRDQSELRLHASPTGVAQVLRVGTHQGPPQPALPPREKWEGVELTCDYHDPPVAEPEERQPVPSQANRGASMAGGPRCAKQPVWRRPAVPLDRQLS